MANITAKYNDDCSPFSNATSAFIQNLTNYDTKELLLNFIQHRGCKVLNKYINYIKINK